MVAHDVSWAAHTGKHLLRTQNASEQNQKHFLPPRHKICVRNKCCARGQTGKHLCRQQCVRSNLSSFALPVKSKLQHPPGQPPGHLNFWKNFCSNSPLPWPKSCSNAPTLGKIARLLFKLFRSFYDASEAVYVYTWFIRQHPKLHATRFWASEININRP